MATALAGTLIERVFSYRKEVKAFRQWQDSAMDISVYMLVTIGVIAATTKPQPQVHCVQGKYNGTQWGEISDREPSPWIKERCRLEALPALHALLEALPYFDYGIMAFALPLFLMQRAPFKIMEKRMVTLYNLIEEFDRKENEESIEEHRAVLIKKSCAKKYCRVGDIYLYSYLLKYPVAILTIIFIHLNWGPSGKLGDAEDELALDPPCKIGENNYKCNIANMKEIRWYYGTLVIKATFWLLLYLACSLSHVLLICQCYTRHKMLRALLISILEEDYYNVDPGDYILLYMLSESVGPGALFAILAQLSCTFEEACTPNMAQWPQCFTKEQNREGSLLHTMEVVFYESELTQRMRQVDYVDQPYHYNVEFKRATGQVESVRSTKSDKITGDEYNNGDVGLVNSEMQNIRNHRTPWWRPALNMKNPEIDLSTVKVIISMEDHVHSSFCSERGEVKGRKMTIGAEVAEDWNFLAIYNGLVVGVSEKANELVLQTKTGDPHQLWKFKDGLLMNKTGLVAECKPRGFPKWWQAVASSPSGKELQKFSWDDGRVMSRLKAVPPWSNNKKVEEQMVLDVIEGKLIEGQGLYINHSHGHGSQRFSLEDPSTVNELHAINDCTTILLKKKEHLSKFKIAEELVEITVRWELDQTSEEPSPQPLLVTIAFFVGGKKITQTEAKEIRLIESRSASAQTRPAFSTKKSPLFDPVHSQHFDRIYSSDSTVISEVSGEEKHGRILLLPKKKKKQ